MAQSRRLGVRFWWNALQLVASGLLLLVIAVGGIWFVFAEGFPWLGTGAADLAAGDLNLASLVVLALTGSAFLILVGGLAGFGAELGRGFAVRLRRRGD